VQNEILTKLSNNELSVAKAYKGLYSQPQRHRRRAHFIKLRITIPDERGVTRFLAFLFFFPIPLFIGKIALRKMNNSSQYQIPLSKDELLDLISVHGIKIEVKTHDGEHIVIKTI